MSLAVSVGRSVGTDPMSDLSWLEFRSETARALSDTVGAPNAEHLGVAEWEGTREESSILTVYSPDETRLPELYDRVRVLAEEFGQESVAVTVGESVLVAAHAGAVLVAA